jgi:hypothetical protein
MFLNALVVYGTQQLNAHRALCEGSWLVKHVLGSKLCAHNPSMHQLTQ